jgi:hypothetical protein
VVPLKVAQEKRAKKFEKFWKEQVKDAYSWFWALDCYHHVELNFLFQEDINRENERKQRDQIHKDRMKKEQKFNEMYHSLKVYLLYSTHCLS